MSCPSPLLAAALIFPLSYQSPNENDTQIRAAQRRLQCLPLPTASRSLPSQLTHGGKGSKGSQNYTEVGQKSLHMAKAGERGGQFCGY